MDNGEVPPDIQPPDGGSSYADWSIGAARDHLDDTEHDVLLSLGAAVAARWNELPRDVQKSLFNQAASRASPDANQLKNQIARFLHGRADQEKNPAGLDISM
jgi:hypothetical protein